MNLKCYHYAMDFPGRRKFGRTYNFTIGLARKVVVDLGIELGARAIYGPYETEEELKNELQPIASTF